MSARNPRTKTAAPKVQAPKHREQTTRLASFKLQLLAAAGLILIGVIALVIFGSRGSGSPAGRTSAGTTGLPNTPDYHSLLVSPKDANVLLLGTHDGLYRSRDGGDHWSRYALAGQDAMNLVRSGARRDLWLAGHNLFAKSTDSGATWQQLAPRSLPSLDLHGFAVSSANPSTLYAALAGVGLFRSDDSGRSFRQISRQVGANVMALAVTGGGTLLAADMQRGLLASHDGGATWRQTLNAQIDGLALNPRNKNTILAAGPGILRSINGGKTWQIVKRLDAGVGPVAFAPADPRIAYAVGFDRQLYRSSNEGRSWLPVLGGAK